MSIFRRTGIAWLAIGLGTITAMRAAKSSNSPGDRITFNRDIAPIVFQYCSSCHRRGEAGPFPLLTYEDVKKHAHQIATVTKDRIMPPWLPEPGDFKLADERRLSDQQIALIQKWVVQGAIEGNAADLPSPPRFTEGWQLGKPDLIVQAEKPFALPASGSDTYWNFVMRVPLDRTRWVKAVEIRPGDKRLVHHANLLVDRTGMVRSLELEPGAGFGGMEIRVESEIFDPDSHFLFWKPGTPPYTYPDGMALRLDKATDLILNTHLQPSGKPEMIQPSIGLFFTNKPATMYPMLLQLENDAQIDIPAGAKDFFVSDDFPLPIDVDLLAIYPHAHYLGKDIQALVKFPNGRTKTLIDIKHWDLKWQAVYRYPEPVVLPQGTTISMHYTYDNSEENVANPNHPPPRVRGGNRSSDEMAHLWLQVLPRKWAHSETDPRLVLQEALARHNIAKNPGDFEAHYNLAAMLQRRGDVEGALRQYNSALQVRPGDAVANNGMGSALLSAGKPDEAIIHLVAALKTRPDYFDAHYNLGHAFASQGNFGAAVDEFMAAVQVNPEDADAEANLGSALAQTGQLSEAKAHFERALRLNPSHELARENLDQVRRITGPAR